MPSAISTPARLRPTPAKPLTNGTKLSTVNGNDFAGQDAIAKSSNLVEVVSDLLNSTSYKPNSPSQAILHLLLDLLRREAAAGVKSEKSNIAAWLERALSEMKGGPVGSSLDVSSAVKTSSFSAPSAPSQAPIQKSPDQMLVTSLGGLLINSSDEPVASATNVPKVSTVSTLNVETKHMADITSIDPVAPQFQDHAKVWQSVIDAGRHGAPLVVDGETLNSPSIVTVDTLGNLVKVPLSAAVDSNSTKLELDDHVKRVPLELSASPTIQRNAVVTTAASSAIIPHVLVAENLAGNEKFTVPPGFILAGDIKLFGGLDAERYTFQGSSSDEKAQMVVLTQSPVEMDRLLPSSGISFGDIKILQPTISVYSKTTSSGRDAGLWLDAGLAMAGSMADAGIALKDVFAMDIPTIDISVHLGGYQGLSDAYKAPNDIVIIGTLNVDTKIGKFLEMKSVKVNLHGVRATAPASSYAWSFTLTGDALFTVPGSVAPLQTTYTIVKSQSTYSIELHLTQEIWNDAMGVPGFHLGNTVIKSTFTTGSKDSAFTFDVDANLQLDTTAVSVKGHYASDDWDFHATIGDFTLRNLENAFSRLFKANLSKLNHDVVFKGLSLDVDSKEKSLVLKGGVTVDTYTTADATLSIGPTGVHVEGHLNKVQFDQATLNSAMLYIVITKAGLVDPSPSIPGNSASFTITGEMQYRSVVIDAEVSFVKEGSALTWVVYAKASATTVLTLSKFIDNLPSDLDFGLGNLVIMASNTNNSGLFPVHSFDYQVKKGFQLFAKIQCPPNLAKAMHSNPVGLILEVDLGPGQKEVDFVFASDQTLSLKPGMVAPSIKTGIILSTPPQLFIEGDLTVQVSGQPDPLVFALMCKVGPTKAAFSASLTTDWINPLNISKQVRILAPVTLEVGFEYVAATYPGEIAISGGIQIGETMLQAAFEMGENPQDEVLVVHAQNLGIRDIISFVSAVIEKDIPKPATDIIFFKDLLLSISSGGTIGAVTYPAGAVFNADIVVFGEKTKVHVAVDKSLPGFQVHAELDPFKLGPLTVSGNDTVDKTHKNAIIGMRCGPTVQELNIDGKIQLFDIEIATTILVKMVPLDITFDAEVHFSDVLSFTLQAHVAGEIKSIKDVVKADFSLFADFEQSLLDRMIALSNTYITAAKKAADEGLESAQTKLTEVQKSFYNDLSVAKRKLDSAQVAWDKKSADVHATVEATKKSIAADEKSKRDDVDKAEKEFNAKIASLKSSLVGAQNDAAAKVGAANNHLIQVTQDANNKINEAVRQLNNATTDMNNRFGDAERKVDEAEANVKSAQRAVDDLQREINDTDNQIAHGNVLEKAKAALKKATLMAGRAGLLASLAAAQAILNAANAVIAGPGYQLARGTMDAAQKSLDAAKASATLSIGIARDTLDATKTTTATATAAAQSTLDAAQKSCAELHVWQTAKAALDTYLAAETKLLAAADALTTVLMTSTEKLAFDAANASLKLAASATKELDAAKSVVAEVEKGVDEFSAIGSWVLNKGGNVFNVKSVQLSGSLNDAANKKPFVARVRGTFAEAVVDVSVQFTPGQAEDFVKELVLKFVDEAKSDLKRFVGNL